MFQNKTNFVLINYIMTCKAYFDILLQQQICYYSHIFIAYNTNSNTVRPVWKLTEQKVANENNKAKLSDSY